MGLISTSPHHTAAITIRYIFGLAAGTPVEAKAEVKKAPAKKAPVAEAPAEEAPAEEAASAKLSDAELNAMLKADLVAYAKTQGVEVASKDTKAQIIEKLA